MMSFMLPTLPTLTWSAHWVDDEAFRAAVDRFVAHEHELVLEYRDDLQRTSPFREETGPRDRAAVRDAGAGGA